MKRIIAYKCYFSDFINKLSYDEIRKIQRALDLFKVEELMPRHFIKYIRDGIYEFRVTCRRNEFRIFFIYDGDTMYCSTLSKRKRRRFQTQKSERR